MLSTWLITGGAGYIGSHTVRALRAAGHRVVVLDDLSSGLAERVPDVPVVQASVLDERTVADTIAEHGVDGVMHLAAKKAVGESVERPLFYWHENVGGLRSLLAAMTTTGVDRLVYTSSAAVYGASWGTVTEDTPCVPVNPYGETKLVGEWMIADLARAAGLRSVALRYFNVAGTAVPELVDRGRANLVPLAVDAIDHGRPPLVFGGDYDTPDGSGVRDYVHVEDVAEAHVAAIAALERPGTRTFNVGVGRGFSVLEVIRAIAEASGRTVEPEIVDRRAGDPASVVADVSRIHAELGWTARHDLADIVAGAWAARPALDATTT